MWCVWGRRGAYRVLVSLEGKRPLGILRHRWENNSKMVLEMDRIELAQDRSSWWALVIAGMNLQIP